MKGCLRADSESKGGLRADSESKARFVLKMCKLVKPSFCGSARHCSLPPPVAPADYEAAEAAEAAGGASRRTMLELRLMDDRTRQSRHFGSPSGQ